MFRRFADASAARLGFTEAQRAAYFDALAAIPDALMLDGSQDVHAIGVDAARRAGYAGCEHAPLPPTRKGLRPVVLATTPRTWPDLPAVGSTNPTRRIERPAPGDRR